MADDRTYGSCAETHLKPSKTFTGSPVQNYEHVTDSVHAVPLNAAGQSISGLTACSRSVTGPIGIPFEQISLVIRCGRCAEALGLPYVSH